MPRRVDLTDLIPTQCAGCNVTPPKVPLGRGLVLTELAPGVKIPLCRDLNRSGTYDFVAKETCEITARKKLRRCPGCGRPADPWDLCTTCRSQLDRGNVAKEEAGAVSWYSIPSGHMFGPYMSRLGEEGDLTKKAGIALARALAATGPRRQLDEGFPKERNGMHLSLVRGEGHDGGRPSIELDEAQAEALIEFVALLKRAGEAQYASGFEDGNNLLAQLSSGQITTTVYDDTVTRHRERAKEKTEAKERR